MAVFTQKEYQKLHRKTSSIKNYPVEQEGTPETTSPTDDQASVGEVIKKLSEIVKKEQVFRYSLLHPENGAMGDLQQFEDIIKINGKDYKRICHGGIVKTTDKPLADFLIKKGYELLEKVKV